MYMMPPFGVTETEKTVSVMFVGRIVQGGSKQQNGLRSELMFQKSYVLRR